MVTFVDEKLVEQYHKLTPENKAKVTRFIYNLLTVQRADLRTEAEANWVKRTEWTIEQRENDPSKYGDRICCTFCGKPQSSASLLIAAHDAYICDECVGMCQELVNERLNKSKQ